MSNIGSSQRFCSHSPHFGMRRSHTAQPDTPAELAERARRLGHLGRQNINAAKQQLGDLYYENPSRLAALSEEGKAAQSARDLDSLRRKVENPFCIFNRPSQGQILR